MHRFVQPWLYIYTPALPHVTQENVSKVTQRGIGGGTPTIFRGQCEVPLGMGQEALQWLWRRGSVSKLGWGWRADSSCYTPKGAESGFPPSWHQACMCLTSQESLSSGKFLPWAGVGSTGVGAVPAKAPVPQPGAAWEGGSSQGWEEGPWNGRGRKIPEGKSYVEEMWGHLGKRLEPGSPRNYYLLAQEQRAKALLCLLTYFSVKEPQWAKLIFNKEYFLLFFLGTLS